MKILKNKCLLICVSAADASLSMPKLILPAIQVNMCAGHFPEPEQNGICYLKAPFELF